MQNNQTTEKKHYVVYHAKNPLNMLSPDASRWLPDYEETEHFHAVADLMAESPEDVFVLTNNHGEGPWTSNPEVWHCVAESLRSTSVGDVIQEAHTQRAWLVLRQGFEELSRVFAVKRDGILIICEYRAKEYVMQFSPKYRARDCWNAISSAGLWSGVLCAEDGEISYPEDLADVRRLKRIAAQYAVGERQFTFPWEQEEEDEEDWEGEEDNREDEVEDIPGRIPCDWGHTLRTVLRRKVEALSASFRFGNTANILQKGYRRLKKLL